MKKAMIPAVVLLVLSLVVILGEPTFLSPCAHADGSFGACHWAGRAALGLGALVAALAALALALPRARLGLYLGEIRSKLFFPDHALALYRPSRVSLPVSLEQARFFQAGQVLPAPDGLRGFCTPTLFSLALGWGKASDGQMKNHYPKGLRIYKK